MSEISNSNATVVGIAQKDYEGLSGLIARIENYRDVVRGGTLTLWMAALGLGVPHRYVVVLIGAIAFIIVMAWADLRLGFQYEVAHRRSLELEAIMQSYIRRLLETDGPLEARSQEQLEDCLAQYTFGSNLNIMRPGASRVLAWVNHRVGWPTVVYTILLFVLYIAALLALHVHL